MFSVVALQFATNKNLNRLLKTPGFLEHESMVPRFTSQIVLKVTLLLRLNLCNTFHKVLMINSGSIAAHGQHALHEMSVNSEMRDKALQMESMRWCRKATYSFDTDSLELSAIKIFGGASNLFKIHGGINGHFASVNLRQRIR